MDETGAGFAEALDEATALGYAEADPTADVDGFDAAAKAAILAGLAFHTRVTAADVHREGIGEVTRGRRRERQGDGLRRQAARDLRAHRRRRAAIGVRVHPAMIPRSHPLAGVRDAYNAVFVEAEAAGQLMFYGRGAGGAPTASAVLGDLVAVARNRVSGARGAGESAYADLRGAADGRDRRPATTSASTWPTSRACSPRSPARSPTHDVSHPDRAAGGARRRRRRWSLVTHTRHRRGAGGDRRRRCGDLDIVRAVASVMRVEGRGRRWRLDDRRRAHRGAGSSRSTATGCRSRAATPVVTLREGGTPLLPAPVLSERTGCEVLPQGRGRQPDRVVQGPRHDDGDHQGGRGGREGGHLRLDRQHQRVAPPPTRRAPG